MTAYILKSAITLALLYCCGFALLSRETFHRFNRFALLGIMVLSLVVPMIHVTTSAPTLVSEQMTAVCSFVEPEQRPLVASIPIKAKDIVLFEKESEPERGLSIPLDINWSSFIYLIYIIGVAAMLILLAFRMSMLARHLRGGLRHTDEYGNTVILHQGDVAPFSVFRFIVMSVDDYEAHGREILTHEQEHIRLGHSYDLLLVETVKALQWFNPFVWLLARNLEAVHEYEADEAVINKGIDAKTYQQLLVLKVVGNRLQPFANNLSHSTLKNRIIMMHKKKSHGGMMLKVLLAIPAVAIALYAFASPTVGTSHDLPNTQQSKETETTSVAPESVSDSAAHAGEKVYLAVQEFPKFLGGEEALLKFMQDNLKYPESAVKAKKQGRVLVRFVVYTDGTIGEVETLRSIHKDLDAEAIRVVRLTSGKWTAPRENGKPVNCRYTLPVCYKLPMEKLE